MTLKDGVIDKLEKEWQKGSIRSIINSTMNDKFVRDDPVCGFIAGILVCRLKVMDDKLIDEVAEEMEKELWPKKEQDGKK